jgi:hypothetical protein
VKSLPITPELAARIACAYAERLRLDPEMIRSVEAFARGCLIRGLAAIEAEDEFRLSDEAKATCFALAG